MCRMTTHPRGRRAARTGVSADRTAASVRAAAAGAAAAAGDATQLVAETGRRLLATQDPLQAELIAAAVLAVPHQDRAGPQLGEMFVRTLCRIAGEHPSPESAALLRAVAAIAPPPLRRAAVAALGVVTAAGHYPPDWAGQVGRAVPGEAWRSADVFGDTETIAVTFRYGDTEHAAVVQIDRCRPPTALRVAVMPDVDRLRAVLATPDDPLLRTEPVGLAAARARVEPVLAQGHPGDLEDVFAELDTGSLFSLPVVRARLRRLPPPEASPDTAGPPGFGSADRAAAVSEFLASQPAAGAGEETVVRFWAELFTGYSGAVPGDPPARIGPLKLPHLLLSYVPNTFALTAEQRRGLPAAATAWTEWAAARQRLPEPALAALRERLPEVLERFDAAYDDPENSRQRGYLADLSATTADAGVLAEALQRRAMAAPPADRQDTELRSVAVAEPAGRRALVEREYAQCQPPDGMSSAEFVAAAVRVSEQLWQDDPPELWRRAQELAEAGVADHDIIHQLAAG